MQPKFCANLSFMFQEVDGLLERYKLAAHAGFKAVECGDLYEYGLQTIRSVRDETDLKQILINTPPVDGLKFGCAAVVGKQTSFAACLTTSVVYAKALDCPNIHIMSGLVPDPTPKNDETFIENLKYASAVLEKNNLTGLIEPINHHSVPDYYLNSYEKAVEALNTIKRPALKLQLDLFHLQQIKGDLTHNIKKLLPYVGHIQIAQVPSRHEPNTPGEINYQYLFNYLQELDYDGWIGLEYKPRGKTIAGLKWIHDFGYSL